MITIVVRRQWTTDEATALALNILITLPVGDWGDYESRKAESAVARESRNKMHVNPSHPNRGVSFQCDRHMPG